MTCSQVPKAWEMCEVEIDADTSFNMQSGMVNGRWLIIIPAEYLSPPIMAHQSRQYMSATAHQSRHFTAYVYAYAYFSIHY